MKTLVVEDDATSRIILREVLKVYGPVEVAINGSEAMTAFRAAHAAGVPFDLVSLDIMMPVLDGQLTLRQIREWEVVHGVAPAQRAKVVMTTALDDRKNIAAAAEGHCDAYLVKPLHKGRLLGELVRLNLIPSVP